MLAQGGIYTVLGREGGHIYRVYTSHHGTGYIPREALCASLFLS